MHSTGPGNNVVKAFEDIAADSKARPTLRCEIARYIGALTYPPEAKVDLQRLANILGHQTVEICRQELDRSKDKGDASRRLVLYVLDSSNEGLQKLSNSADGDAKKFIYDLKKKVETLFQDLDNTEKTPDGDVASRVLTEITNIEGTLLPKPEPEPLVPAARESRRSRPVPISDAAPAVAVRNTEVPPRPNHISLSNRQKDLPHGRVSRMGRG